MQELRLSEITVKAGRRPVKPDVVQELAQSIAELGLLNPILVNSDYVLIAGAHRLEAHKLLGLATIKVNVVTMDELQAELAEIDENLSRNDLSIAERAMLQAQRKRVYVQLHPETKHGANQHTKAGVDKNVNSSRYTAETSKHQGKDERTVYREVSRGERLLNERDEITQAIINTPTIANNANLTEAILDAPDDRKQDIIKQVQDGKIKNAQDLRKQEKEQEREARKEQRREVLLERANEIAKVSKLYRIIYADPPWRYREENHSSEGETQTTVLETHYPTMSIDELCALPIKALCEEDAVLFLWVTSPLLEEAFEIVNAWGFKYKTSMVWDKVKHNVGNYVSVRHELLLICTRGACTPDNRKLYDSVQSVERGKHSEKPEIFREIIDDIYRQGNRIELFRRGDAPSGWDVWGNEAMS